MSDWTEGLEEGVEDLVAGRDPGPHLDPDEIAAYEDGALSPADAERAAEHLVLCRECAELLLDLRALRHPGMEEEAAGDWSADDAAALWERVRAGLRREGGGAVVPFPSAPPRSRERAPAARPPRWLQAVAACLLAAVLVLAVQVATLNRQVERLSQPQLNVPVIDLFPEGTMRRGSGAAGESPIPDQVPGGARIYTLALHLGSLGDYTSYAIEIARPGGEVVVPRRGGLVPGPSGALSLALPREWLGTGDFRIRLYGRRAGGGEEPAASYALRVAPP